MRLLISILIFVFVANNLFAQDYAEFSTDTTRFRTWYAKDNGQLPDRISPQVWYINGQKMFYGSGTIKVEVNPKKMDTILFQGYRRNSLDTIICNISEPKKYKFFYNPCCGRFNLQDESSKKFIAGKVLFRLKNPDKKTYLRTLGETGKIVRHLESDTLKVDCRSAMSPNIYKITFKQIEICKDSIDCTEGTCLQVKGKDEPNWDFGFRTVSEKLNFIFMPLKSEPIEIIYDPKMDNIEIK
jgi:hypothetical protein